MEMEVVVVVMMMAVVMMEMEVVVVMMMVGLLRRDDAPLATETRWRRGRCCDGCIRPMLEKNRER